MYGSCLKCNRGSSLSDNITGAIFRMERTLYEAVSDEEIERFAKTASRHMNIFGPMIDSQKTVNVRFGETIKSAVSLTITPDVLFLMAQWFAKCSQAIYYDHFNKALPVGATAEVFVLSKEEAHRKLAQNSIQKLPFASAFTTGADFKWDLFSYHFVMNDHKEPTTMLAVIVVDDSHCAIVTLKHKGTLKRLNSVGVFKVTGQGLKTISKMGKRLREEPLFRV